MSEYLWALQLFSVFGWRFITNSDIIVPVNSMYIIFYCELLTITATKLHNKTWTNLLYITRDNLAGWPLTYNSNTTRPERFNDRSSTCDNFKSYFLKLRIWIKFECFWHLINDDAAFDLVTALHLTGGRLNKKDGLTRYGDSHVKDKTS